MPKQASPRTTDTDQRFEARLSFYGVGVSVESSLAEVSDAVRHDFSFFEATAQEVSFRIRHFDQKPEYSALPAMTSITSTPRNITFSDGKLIYIDYFGQALNIYDQSSRTCQIFTRDANLAREIIFLTILSRISELLEKKGMYRIHALGLARQGKGALLLAPSGGGKTTLAMSFLQNEKSDMQLLSEDSPLLQSDGTIAPFPLRLGVHYSKEIMGVSPDYVRTLRRMEFEPKQTIDIAAFETKIVKENVQASLLLLGVRSTEALCVIEKASRFFAFRYCLLNSVVGFGLYQGIEFIAGMGIFGLFRHSRLLIFRLWAVLKLLRRARVYRVVLGRDPQVNFDSVNRFLEQELR